MLPSISSGEAVQDRVDETIRAAATPQPSLQLYLTQDQPNSVVPYIVELLTTLRFKC
jgi:hypothetical protein